MASAVDICNLGLMHLGDAGTVAAIDPPEASTQARYCARLYPVARREVMEAHTWRFNTRRKALASVSVPAEFTDEWSFAYGLPADCLRPYAVYLPGVTDRGHTEDFMVETASDGSQILLTDIEGAYLKYVVDVTDAAKLPQSVASAIGARLAYHLAMPITKSKDKRDDAEKLAARELMRAMTLDARSQSTEEWRDADRKPGWVAAR